MRVYWSSAAFANNSSKNRGENVFSKAPDHDRDGAVLDKSLENVIEQHQGRLPAKLVTPWKATA